MKKFTRPKYPNIKVKISVENDDAFMAVWALLHGSESIKVSLNYADSILLRLQVQEALSENKVSCLDLYGYLRQTGNDLDNVLQISMEWVDIDFDFNL